MKAIHKDIEMTVIGDWIDLAVYYSGSDGNAWSFSRCTNKWTNCGNLETFRENFSKRYRGKLFE